MGLDRERMATALEYVTGSCMDAGRGEVYPALISRNGLLAAHFAQADVLVDVRDASDAEPSTRCQPFTDVATDLPDSIDELGYWEILTTLPKPYRSTGHDTAAAELLADLIESHRLTEHCVSAIQVALPASGSRLLDMKLAAQGPFKLACRSCWSVPYSLARVLADGRIDTARFADDHIVSDRAVVRLMQAIDVTFESGRGARWARVTVHTRDGRRLQRESDFFTYELPPHMWHDWLRAAGNRLLPATQLRELTRLIRDLETVGDVSLLLAAARPSQSTAQS
jgi:2-methylcitrate dehydratase PrpD